jgi:exosome complex RNA-binding protein Csl4
MAGTKFKRIDRQRFKKIYPGLRRTPVTATISDQTIILESTQLVFTEASGITQKEFQFQSTYSSVPTVTMGVSSSEGDMVIARIVEITTQRVVVDVTAAFDGAIDLQVIQVVDA